MAQVVLEDERKAHPPLAAPSVGASARPGAQDALRSEHGGGAGRRRSKTSGWGAVSGSRPSQLRTVRMEPSGSLVTRSRAAPNRRLNQDVDILEGNDGGAPPRAPADAPAASTRRPPLHSAAPQAAESSRPDVAWTSRPGRSAITWRDVGRGHQQFDRYRRTVDGVELEGPRKTPTCSSPRRPSLPEAARRRSRRKSHDPAARAA